MKKSLYALFLMAGFTAGLLAISSCSGGKRGAYVQGSGTIYCDDGFKNILDEEIEVFEHNYPGSAIIPFYVSEADAVDALLGDSTESIIITHELTDAQIKHIRDNYQKVVKQSCIAVDAVAMIVNKDNPLGVLSMEEIEKIMKGEINKWNQLAVPDTNNIQLIFDNQNSSTVRYMREKFLGGKRITDNPNVHVYAKQNNAQVFDAVKKNPQAIGIISVSWLGDSLEMANKVPVEERIAGYENENEVVAKNLTTEVKVLGVRNPNEENDFNVVAYKPYQAYIATGEYPLFRKVYMATTASSSKLMKSFYDFVTGFVGQKIIANTGILPYHMNRRIVELK